MNELFLDIINASISASWLVMAVVLLRSLLRSSPKWICVLLWGIVAVRLALPFSVESPVSLVPSAETVPNDILYGPSFDISTGIVPLDEGINDYLGSHYFEGVTVPAGYGMSIISVLAALWLLGVVLMCVYALISFIRLKLKVSTAVLLRDSIYQSEMVSSPFVLGVLKPKIYLPFGLMENEREFVVAHELAHLKRRDNLWKPLGFILLSIHWFNPFMWIAYILLCRDIEFACDEKTVKNLDSSQRADYMQVLVSCSVGHRVITACPVAFGETGVKARVKSVLNYKKAPFWVIALAAVLCAVLAVCFLTDPVVLGDHLVLTDTYSSAGSHSLTYDISLGVQAKSAEIYAECWNNGECVRSAPVVMTRYAGSIDIVMTGRRENASYEGVDVQINTDQYGGSLLTYFEFPQDVKIFGWSYTGHEKEQKLKIVPSKDMILSAIVFDKGRGVRVFDCETLAAEPERLEQAELIVVVRAVFSEDDLGVTEDSPAATMPKEVLSLNDVIILSQKGYELTWSDFEQFDYIETGFGLYIRRYDINPLFHLSIGGVGPGSEPMYIHLRANTDDPDAFVDIRDGGVTEFISKYRDALPETTN